MVGKAVYLARRRILGRLKELGARVGPAAAIVASLREAMRDAPRPATPPAAAPASPLIPDIDPVRRIGRGGFGEVWLGMSRATGGLKAVKIVLLNQGGRTIDPAGREVGSLAQLESQRIAGAPTLAPDGRPLTTPFTTSVPPGRHRVAFMHPLRGPLDGGEVDFDVAREVVARWP